MAFFITKNYGVDLPAETYRLAVNPQITILTFLSKPQRGSAQMCAKIPGMLVLGNTFNWSDLLTHALSIALDAADTMNV